MFLKSGDVALRQIEHDDLKQMAGWRNHPAIRSRTREFKPLNMLDQERWWASLDHRDIMFGIYYEDTFIGVCGLVHIDWHNRSAEFSYYIGNPDFRGKGVGRRVAYLLFEYGFRECGFHRIWAEVYANATDVIAIDKKLGFVHEGILKDTYWYDGRWWDSHFITMLEDDWNVKRIDYIKESK